MSRLARYWHTFGIPICVIFIVLCCFTFYFLSGNKLNSQQQEFVKQIIDYVRENGDIKAEDLIEKSPFDSADILTLFGPDIAIITSIIATMHNSVIAA